MTVDLVIGADGPHSVTRRLAFGPEDNFVHPLCDYMAWFTAPGAATLDGWYQMFNAPGGLVASLRPGREPGVAKASLSFASGPLAYDRHDLEAQRRLLHAASRDSDGACPTCSAPRPVRTTFTSMPSCRCTWTTGPVAGSRWWGTQRAARPPLTGLGTSLALVGARPYVDAAQKLPPGGIRAYAPQSQRAIWARWISTRLMASRPLRGLTRRLFFSKAGAIDLPEYASAAVR
jgi:2-polyprenyl-6-methoxyphenol hydroxylase-like FAD-dependent oxidoreductase